MSWPAHGRQKAARNRTTHGHTSESVGTYTAEYQAWRGIKTRCLNPKRDRYKDYGGRGIRICDRWKNSFSAFLADVGPRPSPAHSIDRKDNDGHYEPGNVRWATVLEQRHNRRDIAREVNTTNG